MFDNGTKLQYRITSVRGAPPVRGAPWFFVLISCSTPQLEAPPWFSVPTHAFNSYRLWHVANTAMRAHQVRMLHKNLHISKTSTEETTISTIDTVNEERSQGHPFRVRKSGGPACFQEIRNPWLHGHRIQIFSSVHHCNADVQFFHKPCLRRLYNYTQTECSMPYGVVERGWG